MGLLRIAYIVIKQLFDETAKWMLNAKQFSLRIACY